MAGVTVGQLANQILGLKQQYDSYLAAHPGADTLNDSTLANIHDQALAIEQELTAAGFDQVSNTAEGLSAAAFAAFIAANPSLMAQQVGGAQAPGAEAGGGLPLTYTGNPTGSGGTGTQLSSSGASGSGVTSSSGSWGGIAKAFIASLGNLFAGVSGAFANPSTYGQEVGTGLAGVGAGLGTALQSTGAGVGAGAQAAGSGAQAGIVQLAPWLLAGLVGVWAVRNYKVSRKTSRTTSGRPIL